MVSFTKSDVIKAVNVNTIFRHLFSVIAVKAGIQERILKVK